MDRTSTKLRRLAAGLKPRFQFENTADMLAVVKDLFDKTGHGMLRGVMADLGKGMGLTDGQLKAVRRMLYQNGLKDKADMFRPPEGATSAPATAPTPPPAPKPPPPSLDALYKEAEDIPCITPTVWAEGDYFYIENHSFHDISRTTIDFGTADAARSAMRKDLSMEEIREAVQKAPQSSRHNARVVPKSIARPEGIKHLIEIAKQRGKKQLDAQEENLKTLREHKPLKWPLLGISLDVKSDYAEGGRVKGMVKGAWIKAGGTRDYNYWHGLWYEDSLLAWKLKNWDRTEGILQAFEGNTSWPKLGVSVDVTTYSLKFHGLTDELVAELAKVARNRLDKGYNDSYSLSLHNISAETARDLVGVLNKAEHRA